MSGPLEGLRVLELATGVAGPYAGRLFAMLGATVVKAEPPQGDPARTQPVDDSALTGVSPLFVYLNAGKRNVAREGIDLTRSLGWADIVIDDRVRSEMNDGLLETLSSTSNGSRRVLLTTSPWGFDAGESGSPQDELFLQAACGLTTTTGEPDREPLRFPGPQSQYMAGVYGATAALGALAAQGFHHVDVGWAGAILTGIEMGVSAYIQDITNPYRDPTKEDDPSGDRLAGTRTGAFPSGAFRCADGYVIPGTVRPIDWTLQCELYGRPDLLEDERFRFRTRWRNREALRREVQPWYDAHNKRDIFLRALDAGWAAAIVMTPGDALNDPHLAERKFLSPVEGPSEVKGVLIPGRPWRSEDIGEGVLVSFSAKDEDSEWFSRELGNANGTRVSPPAIESLKILELTWAWAGPFVGRLLGAFGADVVRVETGSRPDAWRTRIRWKDTDMSVPDDTDPNHITWDAASLFNTLNRNKRVVSVDLTHPEGREVFLKLVATSDALVVNMGHSVLADRGVEEEVMEAVKRKGLVLLNMPALGATGPYRSMPGYGMLMEGMGGFSAAFGYLDEGARATTTYYPDAVAGIHGTLALLSALTKRSSTGKGCVIDLSQQEVTWLQLGEGIAHRSMEGRDPERLGNAEPGTAPSGFYPCKGDRFVAIMVRTDEEFVALAAAASPHFNELKGLNVQERLNRRPEIDRAISAWTRELEAAEAVQILRDSGVPAREVITYQRAYRDGVLASADLLEEIDHPVTRQRAYLKIPIRLDGDMLKSNRAAPVFSQHTDDVLQEWVGMPMIEIAALRESGAVGTVPSQPT